MSRKIREILLQTGDCEKGAECRPGSSIRADSRWRPAASAKQVLLCSSASGSAVGPTALRVIITWAALHACALIAATAVIFKLKKKKNISNRHNVLISPQVNFILFLCIVRILRQKINCPDIGRNESNQYSWASFLTANLNFCLLESVWEKGSLITKAEGPYICFCFCCFRRLAKSMLLLIPLFGINFILFAFIPEQVKTELRLIFDLILGSFQVWHQRFWLDCGADLQTRNPEAGWCDTVEFLNYYFAVKEFANWAKVKQCSQKLGRRWLRWAAFKLQSHHLASCQVWPASVFYWRRVWQHSRHRSGWFSGTSLLFISPISSGNVER